jgi:GNAT superfamily N-acetyltransferase
VPTFEPARAASAPCLATGHIFRPAPRSLLGTQRDYLKGARASLDSCHPGYLSRVLSRFESDGLLTRARADGDARRQEIRLTTAGRAAAAELDARSARQIGTLLDGVDRERLLRAMREISGLLGVPGTGRADGARTVTIRAPRPGDLGWIVYRHGAVYAAEYGWNAGSVLCVPDAPGDGDTARLRVLLVERWARGLGIGGRLVEEVLRFARAAGHRRVTLSTYDALGSARRIYQGAGFVVIQDEKECSLCKELVAQEWERML